MWNLFKKQKPETPPPRVMEKGDYAIAHLILEVKEHYNGYTGFTYFSPTEIKDISGRIEGISSKSIKIRGNWYIIGSQIGEVVIKDFIKEKDV